MFLVVLKDVNIFVTIIKKKYKSIKNAEIIQTAQFIQQCVIFLRITISIK